MPLFLLFMELGKQYRPGVLNQSNKTMRFAAGLMAYFDKIGEMGDPAEANAILGAPATTLDDWMKQRQSQLEGE